MQIDTSYKPCSPTWESWASTQLSEANQHEHHSNMLFQSHPTNPVAPEVMLTHSSVAWVLSTLFVTWDSCWKSQTQVVMRSGCQTHLWGVVSLTKLRAGRGIRSQTSLLLPPHIQNYPAWYPVSAKTCLRLRNFNSKSIKERRRDL